MKKILQILLIIHFSILIAQAQWIQQVSGTNQTLYDIEFLNRNTGWVVGVGGTIKKTTNGGVNWISISHPVGTKLLSSIHLVDSNYAYVVGDFETIIKTTDGGGSWIEIRDGLIGEGKSYGGLFFINRDTGWICGNGQYILKTVDGGKHFDSTYLFWGILTDMYFKDFNTGVMSGETGGTFKTTNAGVSWFRTPVSLPTNQPSFRKLSFINNDTGWIAGGDGRVFRTSNCGSTWDSIHHLNTLPNVMYCAEFVNNNTGWVSGEEGIIYKTTDMGSSWVRQISNINNLITSLWFYNDSIGWGSCGHGKIIHTINGGLTGIEQLNNEVSNNFILYQNYPNPFNGQTTFEFEVNEKNNYKFIIYDILGREISKLFDGNLNRGVYKINFNSEDLNSGTYFYRLISEYNILTKTFQLIK